MEKVNKFIWFYLPVLLWMGVIFYLSSVPSLAVSKGLSDFILRKGAHGAEFTFLLILIYRALIHTVGFRFKGQSLRYLFSLALILTFLYAVSDEWHQTFVPTRNGNLEDLAIDTLGILFGALVIYYGKVNHLLNRS